MLVAIQFLLFDAAICYVSMLFAKSLTSNFKLYV